MEKTKQKINIKFYDGREKGFDVERMTIFDTKSILERFFQGRGVDVPVLFENLGPYIIDFTNVHGWSEEIPDIDPRSARLFVLWAENVDTGEVLGLIQGFFVLAPFTFSPTTVREYYFLQEDVPYYPTAVISSFKSTIHEEKMLDWFLDQVREEISANWKKVRKKTIKLLPKGSDLWKRFVLSFDKIIHFTFTCPSIDREMINALRRNDYRISGMMHLLASPSSSYDEATTEHHLHSARKIIEEIEQK